MQRKVAILQCFQVRLDCKVKLFMLQVFLKQSRFFKIKNTELHIKTLIIEYIITAIPIKIILFLQILLFLDYIPLDSHLFFYELPGRTRISYRTFYKWQYPSARYKMYIIFYLFNCILGTLIQLQHNLLRRHFCPNNVMHRKWKNVKVGLQYRAINHEKCY